MRTLGLVLLVASLLVVAPGVDAAPPSGGDCDVNLHALPGVSTSSDPTHPAVAVTPGQGKVLDCTY